MCCGCTGMAATTSSTYGKIMSRERFLKTVQRKKLLNNKKGGEPCMRIEALLKATLLRIRTECKQQRERDFDDDEDEEYGPSTNKKMKLDNYDLDNFDYEDDENMNIVESCFDTCTMISSKELSSKSQLWDDPEQVEDFFKKVSTNSLTNNSDNTTCSKDNLNNNTIDTQEFMNTCDSVEDCCSAIDFDDSFLDPVDDMSPDLSSFVPNYDVGSFTIEFDNLYKELVQNLYNVESYMKQSQTSCA